MEDEQIIPPYNQAEESKSKVKIVLIILLIILGVGAVGWISFLMGTKSQNSDAQSGNIFQGPSSTPTLASATATPTTTISLTKKPTTTPKSTPTLTPSPVPILKTKIISSTAVMDGFRSSNGGGNNTLEIRAGRNTNLVTRGFVTFEISDIPSGATIQSATLRLYQAKIEGNPYGAGGSIKVDHLTYGDSLDNADYSSPALSSSFVTLTSNATKEWKDADVTERVKDDVANARSTSQFRIHFQTENTGGNVAGDFAYFEAKENNLGTGNTPQLVVKYY